MTNPFDAYDQVTSGATPKPPTFNPLAPALPSTQPTKSDPGFWSDPVGSLGRFLFGEAPTEKDTTLAKQYGVDPRLIAQSTGADPARDKGLITNIGKAGEALTILPFQAVGWAASRIPTGWLPGGADQQFETIGAWQKVNDPAGYTEWEKAAAEAAKDPFYGANLKADFTRKWGTRYYDESKDAPDLGIFKNNPGLAMSPAGSLGQGLLDALQIFGLPGQGVQGGLGTQQWYTVTTGTNDRGKPVYAPGMFTRVGAILERDRLGLDLNPVEQEVVDKIKAGTWTEDRALAYVVREGQGITRDPLGQIVGGLVLDPTVVASLGAAGLLKVGQAGARIAGTIKAAELEAALATTPEAQALLATSGLQKAASSVTGLQKAAIAVGEVQQMPFLKPVFKVARSIIDPFSVLGHDTAFKGLVDMTTAVSSRAIARAYGPAYESVFRLATKYGFTAKLESALGGYAANTARTWTAFAHAASQLGKAGGEHLFAVDPDSIIDDLVRAAPRDAETRLTDFATGVRKVFTTAEDDAQLEARIQQSFGVRIPASELSQEEKSLLHAATYENTYQSFVEALAKVDRTSYAGPLNLDHLVVLNDNTLDNVAAQLLYDELTAASQALANGTGTLADWKGIWSRASDKWLDVADLGRAADSSVLMQRLTNRLGELIDSGRIHTRIQMAATELQDPELAPLREWLLANNPEDRQLWNLGFRPDETRAFGFRRSAEEGKLVLTRNPFVSHVQDAVPAYRPVNDRATNFLGQFIGNDLAAKATKPVEAVEVALRTAQDIVSGQRLLMNMQQRFIVNMAKHDVTPRDAMRLFGAAKDAAGLMHTTLNGVDSANLWDKVKDIVKQSELRDRVTPRVMLDELLDAAGGDMRIMGLTSGFSQRARNMIEATGVFGHSNYSGALTVNGYRLMRYALNPIFYIQRVADAVYFSILKGVPVQGFGELDPVLREVEEVSQRIGATGLARDMAFDMPEMQLVASFQSKLTERIQSILPEGRLQALSGAGNRLQINNMWAHTFSQFGSIVKESLDEARALYTKRLADTAISEAERALYREALDNLDMFDRLRINYSSQAGRILSDDEVGLRYLQEQFDSAAGQTVGPDGLLQFRHDIAEGTYQDAGNVGELKALHQDYVALDLGYDSVAAMRADIKSGSSSIAHLAEQLRTVYNASPDFTKRFVNAVQFDWTDFWSTARESLDLSPLESESLQGIIAREAASRGMTPVDYLSQVLPMTTGQVGVTDHIGQLVDIIRNGMTGDEASQAQALASIYVRTLDPSAQRLLINRFLDESGDLIDNLDAAGTPESVAQANELYAARSRLLARRDLPGGDAARARGVPSTADEYKVLYKDQSVDIKVRGERGQPDFTVSVTKSLGDDLMALPEAQRDMVVQHVALLREQFPNTPLVSIDVPSKFHLPKSEGGYGFADNVQGVTIGHETGDTVILLSPKGFGEGADAYWAGASARSRAFERLPQEMRLADVGMPTAATEGPLGVIYHEFGHAVDTQLRPDIGYLDPAHEAYANLVSKIDNSPVRNKISEYAAGESDQELVAEVFDLTFNPTAAVRRAALPADVRKAVEDFRQALIDTKVHTPAATPEFASLDRASADAVSGHFSQGMYKRIEPEGAAADTGTEWVAREAVPAPADMYAHTVANGGGTFDVATGREAGLTEGFGVGNGPLGKVVANNKRAVNAAYREVSKTGAPSIGTWVGPDGMVYVDPSQVVMDRAEAFALARSRGEQEVYDYATQTSLKVADEPLPAAFDNTTLAASDAPLPGAAPAAPRVNDRLAKQVAAKAAGRRVRNADPDLEGIMRAYSKWLHDSAAAEFTQTRTQIGGLVRNIMDRVPTDGAFTYNRSEGLVQQLMSQKVKLAQRDSFRLAEMSTERTMASRSINHPFFGLYPTSYMWGKVFPETVKFLAKEPFGFESGIAGYTLAKVEQSIAAQREYDPEFSAAMEKIGNSETAFLLDYLTPGLPWSDFRAAAPPWFRQIAKSNGIDIGKMTEAEWNTMSPLRWTGSLFKVGQEVSDFLKSKDKPVKAPAFNDIFNQKAPQPAPAAPTGATGQLTAPLGTALDDLNALFTGQ